MKKIDDSTRTKISTAIADVERHCDSELVCLITPKSARYVLFPLLAAALLALFMPITQVLTESVGITGWNVTFTQQTLLFVLLAGLFVFTPLNQVLTPNWLRQQNCERVSTEQFFRQQLHETSARNAILIFVSWDEKFVTIVADKGINEKVRQTDWDNLIRDFVDAIKNDEIELGFLKIIGGAGDLLKANFPVRAVKTDELANHLIELQPPAYVS